MQLLSTASEMQDVDRLAINKFRIPGLTLMENAGRAFVDELQRHVGSVSGKNVAVVCGKGNNGGDGFVISRHLANRGATVDVLALCSKREVKGDAKANLAILLKMCAVGNQSIKFHESVTFAKRPPVRAPDIIVDAVFGTGFSGRVHGAAERAIRWMNEQSCYIAAVDVASGVSATTGVVENLAVRADLTVTMGVAKIGHYIGAGREHSGHVVVAEISIPQVLVKTQRGNVFRVLREDVAQALPRRPATAHKHSVGKVFVLAGSRNLTGAPTMCAQSTMRIGAGTVILGVPKSIYNTLVRKVTEVMVTPLEETSEGSVSHAALEQIKKNVDWSDVVVIGPGLSTNRETQQVIWELLCAIEKPVVVDADGLNALAANLKLLNKRKHATILTPHVGELSRLIRKDGKQIELFRVESAQEAARQLRSVVVLKGSPTVTGTPTGLAFVNSTGNPGMATAGAGDVLTGVIAGLLGQGMDPVGAAYAGVFIHGMAGDLGAKRFGGRSLMAMDILHHLSDTLKLIEG
jgi:NAD(P)H-hydrate epimerase